MKRELRVKELKVLDEARQRFMQHHQQVKEAELKRLDDEIKRKVRYTDTYVGVYMYALTTNITYMAQVSTYAIRMTLRSLILRLKILFIFSID